MVIEVCYGLLFMRIFKVYDDIKLVVFEVKFTTLGWMCMGASQYTLQRLPHSPFSHVIRKCHGTRYSILKIYYHWQFKKTESTLVAGSAPEAIFRQLLACSVVRESHDYCILMPVQDDALAVVTWCDGSTRYLLFSSLEILYAVAG